MAHHARLRTLHRKLRAGKLALKLGSVRFADGLPCFEPLLRREKKPVNRLITDHRAGGPLTRNFCSSSCPFTRAMDKAVSPYCTNRVTFTESRTTKKRQPDLVFLVQVGLPFQQQPRSIQLTHLCSVHESRGPPLRSGASVRETNAVERALQRHLQSLARSQARHSSDTCTQGLNFLLLRRS